jgi:hypothetical protein
VKPLDTQITPGSPVVAYLHSPREKLWGVLGGVDLAGVYLRAIDLNTFDDWIQAIARGERNIALTRMFLPMWRLERLILDESVEDIPSMADRFLSRVGMTVEQYLELEG